MSRRIVFLKPANGGAVYIPAKGRDIFPEGENVEVDGYIEGRIACGSLVECVANKETKQTRGTK